jgi:hypothetical protein
MQIAARNGHSTAPFAPECQSFLDNLRAGFGANRSANDPTVGDRSRRRELAQAGTRLSRAIALAAVPALRLRFTD